MERVLLPFIIGSGVERERRVQSVIQYTAWWGMVMRFSLFFHLVRNQLFGGELGSSLALVVFCRGVRPCCHECFHSTQLVLFGGLMQWGVTFVVLTVDLRLTLDEEVDAFIMAPT